MADSNPFQKKAKGKFKPAYLWWAVAVIILFIGMVSGVYTVDQKEQAVVLRFGRYFATEPPGFHTKLPFGIDRVYKVPTEVFQTVEFGFRTIQPGVVSRYSSADFSHESKMLTGDLNIVNVSWIIQYRIVDPKAWLFNVDDTILRSKNTGEPVDNRIKTIRDISQSVINMLVGDRTITGVINEDREEIENLALEMIDETLSYYELGIDVTNVKLQSTVPPEGEVQAAFDDVNKATQDMERLINEGKEAYNTEIPKARGQALRLVEEAEGYRIERINRANGDVARFNALYQAYRRDPEITADRLYFEMVNEVFGGSENLEIIDRNLEGFLPIRTLGEQGGAE